jgi:hypothetical protein
METIKISTTIQSDGHLKLDIPTPLKEGDVEVILIIESRERRGRTYDFSDIAGKLKWNGDAVDEQRKLRNEW